jgi:lipoprotein-anchoring transpeptidase ErfK/SrfK
MIEYVLTEADVAGPWTPAIPEDPLEQANLPALGYTSALEMLGERFHASPELLRWLNPRATFARAGEVLRVPGVAPMPMPPDGQPVGPPPNGDLGVHVSKSSGLLTVTASNGQISFAAPATVGSDHDPLPIGRWEVEAVLRNPVFYYDPELFWDADPSSAKARLPAGPNSPVGVVWIGLTRDHYGIHGTAEPSHIGHTESHGCVRLTNWDAERVAAMVHKGIPVVFEE